jgi:acetylornithine/succinyldiaminopimelate/putrescine aminotransferase
LARRWGNPLGKTTMIAFSGGFHGRTFGALSLMDKPQYKDGMGPFLDNMAILPFNDPAALEAATTESTLAVVLEFLQGEGGITSARRNLS